MDVNIRKILVQNLIEIKILRDQNKDYSENCHTMFILLCECGDMRAMKLLLQLDAINFKPFFNEGLITACRHKQYKIVRLLCDMKADLSFDDYRIVKLACRTSFMMASILFEYLKDSVNLPYDELFSQACEGNKIKTAQWLLDNYEPDIYFNNNYTFRISYANECDKTTKLLYDLDNHIFVSCFQDLCMKHDTDIDTLKELGFSDTTIEQLVTIKKGTEFPNIDAMDNIDDIVVKVLCHYHHVNVLEKLCTKFPYIYYEVSDGKVVDYAIRRFKQKSSRK